MIVFAAAGAEVIYAPLTDAETTRALAATGAKVNVLATGEMAQLSAAQIGALGAARISIGGGLARATQRVLIDGARAMLERGDFTALGGASEAEVNALLEG